MSLDNEFALTWVFPALCIGVNVYYYNSSTQLSTIYCKVFKFLDDLYYSSNWTAALLSITSLNGPCSKNYLNFLVAQ